MKYKANSPEEYLAQLPEDRREAIAKLMETVRTSLPPGFEETMAFDMISYVIPHSTYPAGYHVNPKEAVPFISIASQQNYIAFYHMGVYAFPEILAWFQSEYPKFSRTKLDMGKSCIRFKNVKNIPYELIAKLCQKITVDDYLNAYKASRVPGNTLPK